MTRTSFPANVIPMITRSVRRDSRFFALVCSAAVVWSLITPGSSAAEPSAEKPTIVLVHGAWADASSWDGEVEELQSRATSPGRSQIHWKTSAPIPTTLQTSSDQSTDRSTST
jgi:hypothetical protein